ncbi:STAS domain-containing protein [Phytohabitans sp. ZYX-F-186]|uniref:STAS domain-containing protein n=1 Tax=Phytohabitans maris TaxID=3071409 RepID=A0ABU0ZKR0_9ACTN|nr:STAS domain-containing protein [Phytohabitans sp. ZYX-F-186]MDQ7907624.1 STAS domain-containing protein [Phytohabitans sp. ZYX-F-186]
MTLVITTHRLPEPSMTIAITPQGAISSENAHMLHERVIAVLAATRPQRIVVDLRAVPSIDEAGVDALRAVQDVASAQGARLVLADPDPRVRELLRHSGLTQLSDAPVRV